MASTSMRAAVAAGQSSDDDVSTPAPSTFVDDDLAVLRQVVVDLGWTCESIAAAMGRGESYKSHVSRVLNGDRPMSVEFKRTLPHDIRGEWHARLARLDGYVAVKPASDDSAEQHFVGGLLTLLRRQLPARASQMAKASIAKKVSG